VPIFAALERFRRVIVVMAVQMGKTGGLLNVIGQRLDDDPVPMLYIGPTKSMVDGMIEPQVMSMLRSAPSLWEKTDTSRRARKLSKLIGGISLRLAWAGSPTELASAPAHTVLIDEVDKMEPIPGEGDPVTLAEARTTNYVGGRIIITSTPTEGNIDVERNELTGIDHWKIAEKEDLHSPIWSLWQSGTRHEWAVPCPHYSEYFIPRFRLLDWGEAKTPKAVEKATRMQCPACAALIEDQFREQMNAAGVFLAPGQKVVDGEVVGELPENDTASFWVSGLMSPWRSWGERAADWIRAVRTGDQEKIHGAINTLFGEPYSFKGEAPPPDTVRKCIAEYRLLEVPANVLALTCFVDVQKTRLVFAVRGWGKGMESWLIDCGEIWGETDQQLIWEQLTEQVLQREYAAFRIRLMGIDSGFRPGDKWRRPDNIIYEYCMQHRGIVIPTKGRERLIKPLSPSLIDVTMRGKLYKQGVQLWHLDTDYFKTWLMSRMTWPEGQVGRWWVPQDVSDDYCSQVTAETRVAKPSGAAVWIKVRPQNHFLDCEAGNVALAQILGFHRRLSASAAKPNEVATVTNEEFEAEKPRPVVQRAPLNRPMMPRRPWTTGWK